MKSTYIGIGVVVIFIGGMLLLVNSGSKGNNESNETAVTTSTDVAKIDTNLSTSTNKTMTQITELIIEDSVVGAGAEAKAGDNVTVHYVGTLMDGTMFDASKNHGTTGFTFTLGAGQVIQGWDVGVAGMKVGGKRKLTIPSAMAYGNQAVGGVIPANSDLIFEVELLSTGK